MPSSSPHRFSFSLIALLACALLAPARLAAGQPLICHPYTIGEARSLPADAKGGIHTAYDRRELVGDTLALLTPETPIIVRMETLRRAALYATANLRGWEKGNYTAEDRKLATALLDQLRQRTQHVAFPQLALALFDLGFYSETLRQAGVDSNLDGYALLAKAAELRAGDPTIEFALALASSYPKRPERAVHLARARAHSDSPALASNLASHFGKN
jgi:hypothetical protein